MKKVRLAINGFGRIGRMSFRIAIERMDAEIVAINDLTDVATLVHLLKHDTNYGKFAHEIKVVENKVYINGQEIVMLSQRDPELLPWKELGVDVVMECTGRFVTTDLAQAHLKAGARKVLLSAPAKDDTKTLVIGANEKELKPDMKVVSNASCTTNSIAAVMGVLDQAIGIQKAMLTTVHSFTASQDLQDGPGKDLREARAASENLVPTTTGAAKAVAKTLPQFKGKFDGLSVRVPTSVVSISDVTALFKRKTSKEEINDILIAASKEPYYRGIIEVSDEPLVSSDYIGNPASGTVDLALTNVVDGDLGKVVVWYDNEWGYSNRFVEMAIDLGSVN